MHSSLETLRTCITACRKCPRLVRFREHVPEKKLFAGQTYWKKPVPGFGDADAWLLILGLAPSAQGGNRTGRIFTGDASARFLFQALEKEGFANQPTSEAIDDGLILKGCWLTAAVKCVPPDNRPSPTEKKNCFPYLVNELFLLKKITAVLALGGFASLSWYDYIVGGSLNDRPTVSIKRPLRFRHGEKHSFEGFPDLYTCYHPSPQNTNTGKLNQAMLCSILRQIKQDQTHP